MTEDGRRGGAGGGPPDGEERGLPPELRGVDRELRGIRFDPRPGLEDEVLAGLRSGRREDAIHGPGARRSARLGRAGRAVAVLAVVAAVGLLVRAAGGGGEGGAPGSTATQDDAAPAGESFAIRWGSDARVLALGARATPARGPEQQGLRCGRVENRLGCRGTAPGPTHFAAARGPAVLRDFCCLDYDGGGPEDDGVRVVAGQGEAVVSFWIYEDRDGTGSFSDGDLLRTVVDGEPAPGASGGSSDGVRRLDRCCADLDGGPHPDDGIFVLAGGGEHVALAVLYEDETGDGRLSPGDRLRAIRTTPLEDGPEPGAGRR